MKVNTGFDLNEEVLRRIRARDERGGVATRKEVRIFIEVAVRTAIEMLPPAKRKAPKAVTTAKTTFVREACTCAEGGPACTACKARRDAIRGRFRVQAVTP